MNEDPLNHMLISHYQFALDTADRSGRSSPLLERLRSVLKSDLSASDKITQLSEWSDELVSLLPKP